MAAFQVWVRSLGYAARVRVAGLANAQWLVQRLSGSFIFKSSDPFVADSTNAHVTFQLLYGSQLSRSQLEDALAKIPEVQLMMEPA